MKFGTFLASEGKEHFYIMHLSYDGDERDTLWDYARKNNVIGLSHREVNDDWEKIRDKIKGRITKGWIEQLDTFCGMQRGDIVMVLNGIDSLLGVAKVTQTKHKFNEKLDDVFFDHTRQVEWVTKYEYVKRRMLPDPMIGFSRTLSKVPRYSPRWPLLTNLEI